MAHRHKRIFAPTRQGKSLRGKKKPPKAERTDKQDFYPHPLFGPIPMLQVTVVLADGKLWEGRDYDPDYAPPLPKGAVPGDVRKQSFCRMCHTPKYFYVDIPRSCVECRKAFVFTASEQKQWFEVLKFHFDSIPIRCVQCRRKRRSEKALGLELASAKKRLQEEPESPAALMAVAEAIVRLHQRTGQGKLSEALTLARKARRSFKHHAPAELAETYFWEGACQMLAGKGEKARPLLESFLDGGGGGKRRVQLAREASAWLGRAKRP